MEAREDPKLAESQGIGRRRFLANAGKFAAATPPAVAMLMSTSLEASAFTGSVTGPGRSHGKPKHPKGDKGPKGWKDSHKPKKDGRHG